jgi:hypothetical protein
MVGETPRDSNEEQPKTDWSRVSERIKIFKEKSQGQTEKTNQVTEKLGEDILEKEKPIFEEIITEYKRVGDKLARKEKLNDEERDFLTKHSASAQVERRNK